LVCKISKTPEWQKKWLSLSYDTIKIHGGEIKVETQVDEENPNNFGKGEGTKFITRLPAQ